MSFYSIDMTQTSQMENKSFDDYQVSAYEALQYTLGQEFNVSGKFEQDSDGNLVLVVSSLI